MEYVHGYQKEKWKEKEMEIYIYIYEESKKQFRIVEILRQDVTRQVMNKHMLLGPKSKTYFFLIELMTVNHWHEAMVIKRNTFAVISFIIYC